LYALILLGFAKVPVVFIVYLFFSNLVALISILSKLSLCNDDVLTSLILKDREDD